MSIREGELPNGRGVRIYFKTRDGFVGSMGKVLDPPRLTAHEAMNCPGSARGVVDFDCSTPKLGAPFT